VVSLHAQQDRRTAVCPDSLDGHSRDLDLDHVRLSRQEKVVRP
jgi:hypothetical protein